MYLNYAFGLFIVLSTASISWSQKVEDPIKYENWREQQRQEFFKPGQAPIKGYKQFERSNLIWQNHLDNNGSMFNYSSHNMDEYLQLKSTTAPSGSEWDFVGPHGPDMDNDFTAGGVGRVNCIQVYDADTWFIGCSGGGLWKTDNAGIYLPGIFDQPWQNLTANFSCLAISGIAVNPQNQNEIYILTGDNYNFELQSIGIYKTVDGGTTWEPTVLEFTRDQMIYGHKLIHNPDNFLEMYAATSTGLYHTTDGWLTSTELFDTEIFDVEFHPTDTSIVYASGPLRIHKLCCGNLSFDFSDAGIFANGMRRVELEVTPALPDAVYALFVDADRSLGGIYLSIDQAETWTMQDNGNYNLSASSDPEDSEDKGQGEYCMALYAHDEIASSLYYGCVNLWNSQIYGIGGTWGQLTEWESSDDIHADFHDIAYNPYNGDLIAVTDGGVYVSSDGGFEWSHRNHGLHITEFYHLGVDNNWLITLKAAGGSQDNGTLQSFALDGTWSDEKIQGGDGFDVHLNVMSDYDGGEYYSESQYGKLYFTGIRNNFFFDGTIYPEEAEEGIENKSHRFNTPYKVNPNEWNEVMIGYEDVYYSNNIGVDWFKIWDADDMLLSGITAEISNIDFLDGSFGGFVVDPRNNCGSCNDEVWVTTQLPLTIIAPNPDWWIRYTNAELGLPSDRTISDISLMRYIGEGPNYNIMAVSIAGYDSLNKVLLIPDLSSNPDSVINVTYDLPNVPVLCVELHDDGIYVGTDIGVFFLTNGAISWVYHNNGLPIVPVTEIQFKETLLEGKMMYISTYGRGIWRNFLADSQPIRRYVDIDATGNNDGSSWANAFTDLTVALTISNPQDSLWIAEGTYLPGNLRTSKFNIDGEKLFGGFNGTEVNLSERNPSQHITRLSGDIGISGVATDNVYRLLTTSAFDNHSQLNGITFSDGYANGAAADEKNGACFKVTTYLPGNPISIYPSKRPHFENCIFENFYAANLGGVFLYEDYTLSVYEGSNEVPEVPVIMDNCIFRNNTAVHGGALYIDNNITFSGNTTPTVGDANFELLNCTFENNSAQFGGAISMDAQNTNIHKEFNNLTFIGNTASEDGGAIRCTAANDGDLNIHFINCFFANNSCDDNGGAIQSYCGTNNSNYQLPGHINFTYDNCTFNSNSAGHGGGAIKDEMGPGDFDKGTSIGTFNNCNFDSNYALYYGGALYADNTNSTSSGIYNFNDCTLNNNDVGGEGGAIKANGAGSGHSELVLSNCIFTNSDAGGNGGAIYGEGFSNGYFSIIADSCIFENCTGENGGAINMRSTTSGGGTVISTFSNVIFNLNHANGATNASYGGAVRHGGSGIHTGVYTNCDFNGNHSNQRAGAVAMDNANISFGDCDFIGNYCPQNGGAVYVSHSSASEHTLGFTNCNFENNNSQGSGGAILVAASSSGYLHLPILNSQFQNNEAASGGGIDVSGGGLVDLDLLDVEFLDNNSTSDGGAVDFTTRGTVDILNCMFNANTTVNWGGALNLKSYNNDLAINITDSQFSNGDADYAGAIVIQNDNFTNITALIDNCSFTNNEGDIGIGALGIQCYDFCDIDVTNCSFIGNHSLSSTSSTGALYLKSSSATDTSFVSVNDCLFENNTAVGPAGALHYVSDGSLRSTVNNCTFKNNSSNMSGGAVRLYTYSGDYLDVDIINCLFDENVALTRGGAFFSETTSGNGESYLKINQCVLVNNQASLGGAFQLHSTTTGAINNLNVLNSTIANNHATTKCGGLHAERTNGTIQTELHNNIIWGNTDTDTEVDQKQGFLVGLGTINISHSDIQDGVPSTFINGLNNINSVPNFLDEMNVVGVDQIFRTIDDGFSIQGSSPCIDVANGSLSTVLDLAGTPRPQLEGFDIGAYESLDSNQTTCVGDLNNDGLVNTTDLLLFISAYGYPCEGCLADLTGDGYVNTSDLLVFVSKYGNECEP